MGGRRIGDLVGPVSETVGDRMDSLAARVGGTRCADVEVPLEDDRRITGKFPYFVACCLATWMAVMVYLGTFSFPVLLENLCLVFVIGFALFGMYCTPSMQDGPFPKWAVFLFALAASAAVWGMGMAMDYLVYANAVEGIMRFIGVHLSPGAINTMGFLSVVATMFFTTIGVLTVTVAYLRIYLVNVLQSMEEHAREGTRGKSESFFMVPDIIDVESIELEPVRDRHRFNISSMVFLSMYMAVLAMMISSYLFVNPYFLTVMSWKTMLSIMLMLSMFIPTLIIPWQVVKELGAKAVSDAPRPYYLWNGAKRRLFYTFATLGAFMTMFLLSVYFGFSFVDIIRNYMIFLIPLLLMTFIYSFVYANNFSQPMKYTIAKRFEDWKQPRERS